MFDIGWSELLVIGVVALVVVGPKELPGMLRTVGRMMAGLRRMASDFQSQFNEAMREAELDELRREVDGLRRTASGFLDTPDIMGTARDELKGAIEQRPAAPQPVAPEQAAATPTEVPAAPSSPEVAIPLPGPEPLPELPAPDAVVGTPEAPDVTRVSRT